MVRHAVESSKSQSLLLTVTLLAHLLYSPQIDNTQKMSLLFSLMENTEKLSRTYITVNDNE